MTIRTKTILSTALALACVGVVVCLLARFFVLIGFGDLEQKAAEGDIKRIHSIFVSELEAVVRGARDWSMWDDAYDFVADGNQAFIDSNLPDPTFSSLKLNVMMFVDTGGRVVYSKAFDLEHSRSMPLPPDPGQYLSRDGPLFRRALASGGISGFVRLRDGPMMIVLQPIIRSDGSGAPRGLLVEGRMVSNNVIHGLARTARMPLRAYASGEPHTPQDCLNARLRVSHSDPTIVTTVDSNTMCGYLQIYDVLGKPCLMVKAYMRRPIYHHGIKVVTGLVLALAAAGGIFGTLNCLLMDRLVLARLAVLHRAMKDVVEDTARRPVPHTDARQARGGFGRPA